MASQGDKRHIRVEAVIPDHCERLVRECALIFHDVIQVLFGVMQVQSVVPSIEEASHLVVAPRHHHIFQPAVGLVYTIFGGVHSVIEVWIAFESLGIDIFIRESTAHDEGILQDREEQFKDRLVVYLRRRRPIGPYSQRRREVYQGHG